MDKFKGGFALIAIILIFIIIGSGGGVSILSSLPTRFLGLAPAPDKLGWMDDAEMTASDRARLDTVKGMGSKSDGMHLLQGGLSRRDFELIRQDWRRARAAYPEVKTDDLTYGVWMPVSLDAKVPIDWGGGNSHGTMGDDGKWYLDGGCYKSLVRREFTERASAIVTKQFFADLKAHKRAQKQPD